MYALKTILPVCAIGILLVNCGRKNDMAAQFTAQNTNWLAASRTAITNKPDLQRLLVTGLPTNTIVAHLGSPSSEFDWNDGSRPRLRWSYKATPFPAGDTMPGYYIVGISIDITNGCLEKWGFDYMGAVGKPIAIAENSRENNIGTQTLPVLKLFIVSSNATADSQFVDTKVFPKLGYISSVPIIQISKLKALKLEEAVIPDSEIQSHKDWILYLELTSTDAIHFLAVTTDNFGKLMLMMVDDKPLCPVFISDPIPNGILRIDMTNEATMEIAKEQLAKMAREVQ